MDINHIKKLAAYYSVFLQSQHIYAICNNDAEKSEEKLNHIAWMCNAIIKQDNIDKMNRWLGFIQGILWANNIFKIDEMRNHNRDINNIPEIDPVCEFCYRPLYTTHCPCQYEKE